MAYIYSVRTLQCIYTDENSNETLFELEKETEIQKLDLRERTAQEITNSLFRVKGNNFAKKEPDLKEMMLDRQEYIITDEL